MRRSPGDPLVRGAPNAGGARGRSPRRLCYNRLLSGVDGGLVPDPLKTFSPSRRVQVAALALLALALRLLYVWQLRRASLILPEELDPAFYYNWAKEIAAGDWLGKGAFVQSPLYAYALGIFMKLFGS